MKHYPKIEKVTESPETCRRQEIGRLRQMAAEAAKRGDRLEALKLDRLADDAAQTEIPVRPRRKKQEQPWLFEVK